jgi:hypothetical protein
MLDTSRMLEFRRAMRDAIGITVDDTSGRSSIVANVATKGTQQGVDDTVVWVRELQKAGTLTAEQAERIVELLNRYSRWR